jgi:cyclopropane fatty-acyl-phospholipid synthase-like methyltransferase
MSLKAMDGGRRITSMPLYVDVHRIHYELAELGIGPEDPLTPDQLFPFDQLHYHGTDAVRAGAGLVGLGRESRVLEVGSGFGGPARYLAHTVGCHVTALELQREMHEVAAALTGRCRLDARVTHVRGDALTCPLPDAAFDAAVSWLAIHHIPSRGRLMSRLAAAVRPGGRIYIEDLIERAPFSPDDAADVRQVLYGETMTSADAYVADLMKAGFADIELTDMTPSWTTFSQRRAAAFTSDRDRHARVHGEATASRLDAFFSTVSRLFASGSLGGIRLTARRP